MNARIQYFQFQMLQRSLVFTNTIRENNQCDHNGIKETIAHLVYECNRIGPVWTDLEFIVHGSYYRVTDNLFTHLNQEYVIAPHAALTQRASGLTYGRPLSTALLTVLQLGHSGTMLNKG